MELTEVERLLLMNQYEILRRLDPDEERRHQERIEILSDGLEILYHRFFDELMDPMPAEEGRFVFDVLDMYRAIHAYCRDHSQDEEVCNHCWATFAGFDGNSEGRCLALTEFVIQRLGKWTEQLEGDPGRTFNSHAPFAPVYAQMLQVWQGLPAKYQLGRDQVLEVLGAV